MEEPYKPTRPATLKDVAQRAGVAAVTASAVLNKANTGTRVAPATRERIVAAAAELRYFPNSNAQALRGRRAETIGICFGYIDEPMQNPYASALLAGLFSAGRERNYNILLWARRWINAEVSAPAFRSQQIDGVVVVFPVWHADIVQGLKTIGMPQVVVGSFAGVTEVAALDVDNVTGAILATRHLIGLGHTRIAYLEGAPEHIFNAERSSAFRGAMAEAGLAVREEYRLPGTYSLSENYHRTCHLLSLPEPPTAIFAWNDEAAYQVLRAAYDMRIPVPEQLSIVGFDDQPMAATLRPPLTTVQQDIKGMGKQALSMLIDIINGTPPDPLSVYTTPTLIVRESTAPPLQFQ